MSENGLFKRVLKIMAGMGSLGLIGELDVELRKVCF